MRPLSVVRSLASLLLVASSLATVPGRAEANLASTFPQKPIRMVVTFPAGGGTDSLARLIGADLSKSLGQPVVVDNRPGASGNIGAEFVAKSPGDGYTLLIVNSSFAINPSVFKKLQFNPKSDFSAVITFASVPSVIAVPAHSKLRTLNDLLTAGKSGTPPSYASCGNGTPQHLAGELLKLSAKIDMLHVPYKGCAPAIADVLGNQAEVSVNTLTNTIPYLKSNKLRALAVTSKARSPFLPDVPTVSELGVAGYDVDQWFGILAPANTPPEIVQKLNAEIARAIAKPEIKASLTQLGFATTTSTPAEFQKLVNADIDRWQKFTAKMSLVVD
ncbi:ABC transporter substrate-binding protein [Cupriavidus taiwanensis]|uniref:tripartite tricarboxylate transporter substrate binding protein n=1 Tax=Cupriavidus taiwanensis TaxID=164546 RepID=UPI001F02B453|nr:tripartite tricarboxylate transporter substrate binding protein [Cupriavidus taiwanensis]ULX50836.1 ABC transporter substrate-binding protein [Cupriavidus taiwanensis]